MKLRVSFPDNLASEDLINQERIPCLCKVADCFEVVIFDSSPEVTGVIEEWDRRELALRAVAGAGGKYSHYARGLITIRPVSLGLYDVIDLQFFYASMGWCPVIRDGEYAPPLSYEGDGWGVSS
ncbi:hypothetical protein [Stenotrophomonas sp. TD3]|uniref:hypothetical protein n=1 Tax=Stenotrophomonas sp. TD3 TaxID=1641707 RepID=UPI0009535209|nr:hypothetical protein [Stenotrophomonas sp. TD3]